MTKSSAYRRSGRASSAAVPPQGEWFLLYRVVNGTIVSELSCPTDVDNGFVKDWAVRVLLRDVELDAEFDEKPLPENEDDYDVDYWIEEA